QAIISRGRWCRAKDMLSKLGQVILATAVTTEGQGRENWSF
ncbi:hypothetical protein HKBW3S09_01479, partial [Candidatus Hakubella thermalkaliphila]